MARCEVRGAGGRNEDVGERVWRSSGGWCWRWKRNGALFWRLGGLLLLVTARPPAERPKDALLRGLFTTERAQGRRAHRHLQPLHALCSTKGSLNRRRGSLNGSRGSPRSAFVQRPRPLFAAAHSQCTTTTTAGTAGCCLLLRSHASVSLEEVWYCIIALTPPLYMQPPVGAHRSSKGRVTSQWALRGLLLPPRWTRQT
jgi:hypothetical protein